jgi:gluconolactonase
MRKTIDRFVLCAALVVSAAAISTFAAAQAPTPAPMPVMPPSVPPSHVVNLMTNEGSAALGAQWKISDVKIVEVPAAQGLMPKYKTTYSIEPQAGVAGFDDSKWESIEAKDLSARRSGGHVAFMWYRATLTMPEKIGTFETNGAQAVATILVDDYAEVWVNGQMPRKVGLPSPATIQGFNMPNRVVLAPSVKAGDKFQLAVFGINGPISASPANAVWFRQASIEFYK